MKHLRKTGFALLLTIYALGTSQAQVTISDKLNEYFKESGDGSLNGNVLLADKGQIIFQASLGYADFPMKRPNQPTSVFNLASIAKIFTSTAILQLCEKRQLNLDDHFQKHFPAFPYSDIRIIHLLSHTSGLPDLELYVDAVEQNPDTIITNADIIPSLQAWSKNLYFIPGDQWRYCNTGYELLALLVEKISGLTFSQYLSKNIFQPAGMENSYLQHHPTSKEGKQKPVTMHVLPAWYSNDYVPVGTVSRFRFTTFNLSATYGASNIVTSTTDLLKFDQAFFKYKLLTKSTVDVALTPIKLNDGSTFEEPYMDTLLGNGKGSYGLGWRIFQINGKKAVGHGGFKFGLATFYLRTLSTAQTIISYDNTADSEFGKVVTSCYRIMRGESPIQARKKVSLARMYGVALKQTGTDQAIVKFHEHKSDTARYYLSEQEFNWLGYDCLYGDFEGHVAIALEVFKVNTLLFPQSFNVCDSYAEALAKAGKPEMAIAMYKKSLVLNPQNMGGKDALDRLLRQIGSPNSDN